MTRLNLGLALLSSSLLCVTVHAQQILPAAPTPAASTPNSSITITNSAMDAQLFYQVLISELNAIQGLGGSVGTSYQLMLDAARKTNDATLFQRAIDMAIAARAGEPALEAARAWKQAQPQSREANWQVLQVLLALNRLNETSEPLRTQIQLTPPVERNGAIAQIPRIFARASDKKAAATLVEQALESATAQSATAAASWTAIGRMRLAAADALGAVQAAGRAQNVEAASVGAAQLALEIMDPKQPDAEPIVRRYLEGANPSAEVRLGYVRALMDAQRFGEAYTQIVRVTRERPNSAEAWALQGALELQENQLDKSDASLKKYIELITPIRNTEDKQRGLTQAYLSLAQIAEKRRDFALAESWLAKIDSPQALVSTQNRRASLLAKQGRMQEARALIARLPERAGVDGAADRRTKAIAEAQLLKDAKDFSAAYDVLQAAAERAPQDYELIYQQANAAEKLKRHGEMERLLRRVIEIKPDYAYAYNFLGYSMADRNVRLPEAKELLKKPSNSRPATRRSPTA